MGLFDLFKQKKIKPLDKQWITQFLQNNGEILSSDQNDKNFRDKGYRGNPTVYSIISTVQKNAGMVKWKIYKKQSDGTKKPYNEAFLSELLYNPNGLGTWNYLIQQAIGNKLLYGNTYFWGIKNDLGKTGSLYVLPSDRVEIIASEGNRGIKGYNLDYFGRSAETMIPAEDIYHIKNWNPRYDGNGSFLYGQSPLYACLTSLYSNTEAIETSRSYLLQGGPKGILNVDISGEYGEMDESQLNSLRMRWARRSGGSKNAGKTEILQGKNEYIAIGDSAADLKLIEHYNLTVNDICNAYSFPTILIGNGDTTFANLSEAKKALWNDVIIPALTEIKDALNCWLVPQFGRGLYIDFDLSDIAVLQDDKLTKMKSIDKYSNILTVNEVRAELGFAPIEGPEGEEIYMFRQGLVERPGDSNKDKSNEDNSISNRE